MSTVFKAASALSLALTTVAALSVTEASLAFEASDEVPEAEIVIDPSLLESSDETGGQKVGFADFVEVSSEIPQDVIEADRLANEKRAEVAAKLFEYQAEESKDLGLNPAGRQAYTLLHLSTKRKPTARNPLLLSQSCQTCLTTSTTF